LVVATESGDVPCPGCGARLLAMRHVAGYLYLLTNAAMPGLVKIGVTTRPVSERVADLDAATGVPERFVVAAYFESSDPAAHERSVHSEFGRFRVKGREFFRVGVDEAVRVMQRVTGTTAVGKPLARPPDTDPREARWRCNYCKLTFTSTASECPKCRRTSSRWWT